jgi:hypothetical protein
MPHDKELWSRISHPDKLQFFLGDLIQRPFKICLNLIALSQGCQL